MNPRLFGGLCALAAAAAYGASFPLTKQIQEIHGVRPLMLAGLFYFSQSLAFLLLRGILPKNPDRNMRGRDVKWMAGAAFFGGMLGPALYLFGQDKIPAYTGALLSPTEILFTTIIAVFFFGERLTLTETASMTLIIGGAVLVGFKSGEQGLTLGALLVIGSFLMWGVDNNFTTRIADRDPFQIALYKGLAGGTFNLAAAFLCGEPFPAEAKVLAMIAGVGIGCYGASYVVFIAAMRRMGASRSTAMFGTNVAFGVALAWLIRDEIPTLWNLGGGVLMAAGVYGLAWLGSRKQTSGPAARD